jgi:superoxide dismutase, Fe-Mn family
MITRRDAIKTVALAAGAFTLNPSLVRAENNETLSLTYPFKLPELGYSYDALEPHFDARTMELHHDKHHKAYVDNLNKALAGSDPKYQQMTLNDLLTHLDQLPENIRTMVRNNAGGHYNHSFWWPMLKKNDDGKPSGELAKAIDDAFGGYSAFQEKFTEAATKVFGSGWAWVAWDGGKLKIESTPNQDTTISKQAEHGAPLLGIDVWEHSYYLKYQNRRPEYIKAFWNVINWPYVQERYRAAVKTA